MKIKLPLKTPKKMTKIPHISPAMQWFPKIRIYIKEKLVNCKDQNSPNRWFLFSMLKTSKIDRNRKKKIEKTFTSMNI